MQETGSNADVQKIDLSTELSLGGLSFFEGGSRERIEGVVSSLYGSCEKNRVYIYGLPEGCVYIACLKEELLFAEKLPCATSDDVLYYCSVINSDFDTSKCRIEVSGVGREDNVRLLKKYFKQVLDANNKR